MNESCVWTFVENPVWKGQQLQSQGRACLSKYDLLVYDHGQPDAENGVVQLKLAEVDFGTRSTSSLVAGTAAIGKKAYYPSVTDS